MFDYLSKEVLLDVMSEYDLYIQVNVKKNKETSTVWYPVSMAEFYTSKYNAIVANREDMINKELEVN